MIRLATLSTLVLASPVLAQPSLRGIGFLPNPNNTYSECYGISSDGSLAVGGSVVGGSGFNQLFAACANNSDFGIFPVYDNHAGGVSAHAMAAAYSGQVI